MKADVSVRRRETGLLIASIGVLAAAAMWGLGQIRGEHFIRILVMWIMASCSAGILAWKLLRPAKEKENTVNEGVRETLSALSHDLRTPVASVSGMAELALDAALRGEAVEEQLRQILVATHAMELITDDLLDAACPVPEHRKTVFTGEMLEQEMQVLIAPRAKEKRQIFCANFDALRGMRFEGDHAAVSRVLLNLLTNAVKYTQDGGRVELTTGVRQRGEKSALAVFAIRDNGMGMCGDFMARMYQPFSRSDEAIARRIQGKGLGLTIVRRLVQRMDGTIEVHSERGKGTTFTVCVPFALAQEEEAPDTEVSLAGQSFLLAEDNALGAQIAMQMLVRERASVRRAADGWETVRLFAASSEGEYAAILMDLRMPGLDGCEAAQAIRAMKRPDAARIPIVAMTASSDRQDIRKALEAGMNAYITKPAEPAQLAHALASCAREGLVL